MMALRLTTRALRVVVGEVEVSRALALAVAPGEVWAILGRNGVGKTTLLHTLAGLRRPLEGDVSLDGVALTRWPRRALARQLGLLPQDDDAPFPGTVLESVLIGRHPHLPPWSGESDSDIALARTALSEVGLSGFAAREVATLSGGERRRMALARLLCQQSPLMLLDEPTNHLDPAHALAVLRRLRQHAAGGGSAIAVLHDLNLAARFCDRLLLLLGEGCAVSGTPAAILTPENLEQLYGVPMATVAGPHGPIYLPA